MLSEITSLENLRAAVAAWRHAGERVALVPTMGALHEGHLALVAEAKKHAARVVVSIFVNPTQFGPNEDFDRYPRTLAEDLAALRRAGADAAWLPDVATMYPSGHAIDIHMDGPLVETLEGAIRPGHFDGVATVVSRLFTQVLPDVALFGEKDFQQLCVIKRLAKEAGGEPAILGVPTLREEDGLALSSRNRYLDARQRGIASRLNQVLRHSGHVLRVEGRPVDETLMKAQRLLMDGGFDAVDYVALCDETTLAPLSHYQPNARLLAAARLGSTRLIDNFAV
jgi:pantoate--beta-alanine ligase